MKFIETKFAGLFLIEFEEVGDERGTFQRLYCHRTFEEHGLDLRVSQTSLSFNRAKHTLRGIHYQVNPAAEAKLVRCCVGKIFDVAVDLRVGSSTFGHWFAIELSPRLHNALFIPRGFGHGFMTLEDGSEVEYQISTEYAPEFARGVRWDDAALGIAWPAAPAVISERDAALPGLERCEKF